MTPKDTPGTEDDVFFESFSHLKASEFDVLLGFLVIWPIICRSVALWICCYFYSKTTVAEWLLEQLVRSRFICGTYSYKWIIEHWTQLCSSVADKHKMERFLGPDAPTVVSVYAPITFNPAGVLLFKQRIDGEMKRRTFIWKLSRFYLWLGCLDFELLTVCSLVS